MSPTTNDAKTLRAVVFSHDPVLPRAKAWITCLGHVTSAADDREVTRALSHDPYDALIACDPGPDDRRSLVAASLAGRCALLAVVARRDDSTIVNFLEGGFDDVLPWCVSAAEIIARVGAIRRRATTGVPETAVALVDKDRPLLRRAEANLLKYLIAHADRIVSQHELVANVFGGEHTTDGSIVRVHVATLRRRLGDAGDVVRTFRGRGYGIDPRRYRQPDVSRQLMLAIR